MKLRIFPICASALVVGPLLIGSGIQPVIAAQAVSNPAATQTVSHPVAALRIRGLVIGQGDPKTIVPTTGSTSEEVLQQARQIAENPNAEVIEYRIDYLDFGQDADKVAALGKQIAGMLGGKPMILTFRTKPEGGSKAISDDDYGKLYSALIKAGFTDLLDVEMFRDEKVVTRTVSEAHKAGIKVIMSSHDFDKTPPTQEIVSRLRRQQDLGADILKIAVMPHDSGDVLKLLDATWQMRSRYTRLPMLTMSMGGIGLVSRMSGEVFGSDLTFGMIGEASAPGPIDIGKLRQVLDTIHGS